MPRRRRRGFGRITKWKGRWCARWLDEGGKLRQKSFRGSRALAERFLPQRVVHRKKKNFAVPFRRLCQNEWRSRVEALLLEGPHLEVLDRSAILRIWEDHLNRADRTRQVFSLLTLALWIRSLPS